MSKQLEFWEVPEPPRPKGTDKIIDWDKVRGVDLVADDVLHRRYIKEVSEPFCRRLQTKRALQKSKTFRASCLPDPGPDPVDD